MDKTKHVRKAVLLYLAAIVAPALVLLYLGLRSVQQQRRAVDLLVETNRRLSAERLAAELENRTRSLAAECLRAQTEPPPFHQVHPIARHYFLIEGGGVRWPALRTPPSRMPEGLPEIFQQAQDLELRSGRLEDALAAYRRGYELARSDAARALALSRIARCEGKLSRAEAAALSWKALLEKFGSLSDPSHRPYGLIARFELGQIDGLYDEILAGRWDLTAEQFDYYMARLNRKPPADNRFEFAREMEGQFRHEGPLVEGELYRFALPHYQLWYVSERNRILGLAVDSGWVRTELEPRVRAELGIGPTPQPETGREAWIYAVGTLLVMALLAAGVVLLLRDVNRERRLSQLRADFVSGVSHELKTPLTLIRLYAETLLLGKDFPEQQRHEFYQIITRESERLSHLIERVLRFSRIERGEQQYALASGDLGPVVARTVDAYENYLHRIGFEVERGLDPGLPPVRFDPDAVTQAMVNLLDNALKYSGDSKFVGIRLQAANGQVVLEVEDHGMGIAPEHREKIFERFYRVPNGSSKGGYGLGLFLVRHIMEAHGGRIDLESEPGRGSRFRLLFPVAS